MSEKTRKILVRTVAIVLAVLMVTGCLGILIDVLFL